MLLIPIRSYRLAYNKTRPRPFYSLDALILRAMREAHLDTAAQLENEFGLPRRVIVERLLRLLEEGYIAVRRANVGPLRLTNKALDWLNSGEKQLESGKNFEPASIRVLMERISGRLLSKEKLQVKPLSERDLLTGSKFPVATHILPQWVEGHPWDEVSARRLFSRKDRVHRILGLRADPEILYWPVDVIPSQRKTIGLPAEWKHLEGRVLEHAYVLGGAYNSTSFWENRDAPQQAGGRDWAPLDLSRQDILRDHDELRAALQDISEKTATGSTVLVITPDFDERYFEEIWRPLLLPLLRNGVEVNLLWNARNRESRIVRASREALARLSDDVRGPRGRFLYNQLPAARCETSLLMVSSPGRGTEAIVGTPSWMSKIPEPWVAVRMRGPSELMAELTGIAAALVSRLWSDDAATSAVEPSHWRELSARLMNRRMGSAQSRSGVSTYSCNARIVRSYDFEPLAETLALHARRRFVLHCGAAKETAKNALLQGYRRDAESGAPSETIDEGADLTAKHVNLPKINAAIVEGGGFHLIADNVCVLGGPLVFGEGRERLQLGLMLESEDLVRYLTGEPPEIPAVAT